MSGFAGRFGALADAYRAFRPGWPAEVGERILARVPPPRRRALDLGSGTGLVTAWLAPEFVEVVALEPDAAMRARIEPRQGLSTRGERAEDARFEAGSFQLVTAGNAFHWMDGTAVLARAWDWLAPRGTLALFRYDPPHDAAGPLGPFLRRQFEVTWRAHVDPRLFDTDYARRTLAASPFAATLELQRLSSPRALTLPELMGFLRSTSYAGGFARAQPDPEAAWRALETDIVAVAGPGPFAFEFRIELLLATRP